MIFANEISNFLFRFASINDYFPKESRLLYIKVELIVESLMDFAFELNFFGFEGFCTNQGT